LLLEKYLGLRLFPKTEPYYNSILAKQRWYSENWRLWYIWKKGGILEKVPGPTQRWL